MKPFIKYPGGKLKEFSLVEKFKPTNIKRYFEPFVGGGSIYFNINISNEIMKKSYLSKEFKKNFNK